MRKLSSLSIFYPCLNDGKTLPYLLTKTYWILPRIADRFEVIIIENGSTDETPHVLTMLKRQHPELRVFHFPKPLGYGGTLQEGFRHARGEWVFYTDGDGQYDPLEIVSLVKKVTAKVDVVNGYKKQRADRWYRGVMGSLYSRFLRTVFHPPIRDVDCDFRLIRRSLLEHIYLTSRSGAICLELILKLQKAGARFSEVGVSHYPRAYGTSEFFRLPHLLSSANDYWHFFENA